MKGVSDMKVCREATVVDKEAALASTRGTEEKEDGAVLCQTSTIHPIAEHVWRRQNPHQVKKLRELIFCVGTENGTENPRMACG